MASSPRTALVTGAASGIGAAIVRKLTSSGLDVIGLDARPGSGLVLDLSDSAAVTHLAASGDIPQRLDVLVNCAGIYEATVLDPFDLDHYRRVLDVNLTGALQLTTALLPRLRESHGARVLNVSSVQGYLGEGASLAYGVSKAGLANATRVLATALAADGILVNAIAPGFIETPMAALPDGRSEHETEEFRAVYLEHGKLPLGRPGTPEEVAEVAAFLVSEENSYVTGQIVAVDGGLTATF